MSRIKIHIHLFASLEEKAGQSQLAEEVEDGSKLEDIWNSLKTRFGFQQLSEHILIAKNGKYASGEIVVQDGDEISFFPPVVGG